MSNKLLKAFSWDFFGSVFAYGSTLVTSIFLARLLTPEQFGIVAIAMVFILYFGYLSELGFKHALIQAQNTNQRTYSSIFYVNLAMGLGLSLITFLIAPVVADFYKIALLTPVIRILSVVFVFNSLTTVQIAILSKNLNFKALSIRIVISKLIGALVGVFMALKGFGVYALVWQEVIFSVLNAILLWALSDWRPSWSYSSKEVKSLVKFGSYIFYGQVIHQSIIRLDELVIGKIFSTQILGYFGRSDSISQMFNGITLKSTNNFLYPIFSKFQDDRQKFISWYFNVYRLLCMISFFIAGLGILLSEQIIIGLFGKQWYPSVDIFEILVYKIITLPISAFLIVTLLSQGFSKENFYYGLVKKGLRVLPILIAFIYGFNAFLYALVIVSFISLIFGNYVNSKFLKVSLIDQFIPLFGPGLVFLILTEGLKLIPLYQAPGDLGKFAIALIFITIYGIIFIKPGLGILKKLNFDF